MCTAHKPEIAGGDLSFSRLLAAIAWERVRVFPVMFLFVYK